MEFAVVIFYFRQWMVFDAVFEGILTHLYWSPATKGSPLGALSMGPLGANTANIRGKPLQKRRKESQDIELLG